MLARKFCSADDGPGVDLSRIFGLIFFTLGGAEVFFSRICGLAGFLASADRGPGTLGEGAIGCELPPAAMPGGAAMPV